MVTNIIFWPIGDNLCQIMTNGYKLWQMIANGDKWLQIVTNGDNRVPNLV